MYILDIILRTGNEAWIQFREKNIFYFPIAKKNPQKLYDTNTYNLSKSDTDFVVLWDSEEF